MTDLDPTWISAIAESFTAVLGVIGMVYLLVLEQRIRRYEIEQKAEHEQFMAQEAERLAALSEIQVVHRHE